jgi:hypothetical protein
MGHIDPVLAQLTSASTLETTNSAAGLAETAADVDKGRVEYDEAAITESGLHPPLVLRERTPSAALNSCLFMLKK